MISLRKLQELPRKTRLRKIVRLLQAAEIDLGAGRRPDDDSLRACAALLGQDESLEGSLRRAVEAAQAALAAAPAPTELEAAAGQPAVDREEAAARGSVLPGAAPPGTGEAPSGGLRRALNRLRHELLFHLGEQPAEWDLLAPGGDRLDAQARRVLPVDVYLEEIRSPFNVGAIFRTAEAFGVRRLLLSPGTASPLHPRAEKTSRGAVGVLPWRYAPLSLLEGLPAVALETGGTPLAQFVFPPRGVLLVGSEELGLSPQALELAARSGGRLSIPMAGAKRSLNVAVAFGIAAQAWHERLARAAGP